MRARSPSRRRRGLPLGRFLAVVGLTVLACYGAAALLPHDPAIRYQSLRGTIFERAGWIFERIHADPRPIDVVVIGSSRAWAAARADRIEAALAARGLDLRVANFSLPASGFDIRDTILRETLRAKAPRLVIVPVVEALPRDGHQAFGDLATAGEVLSAPWIVNRTLPANLARLPVRQMELALATLVPEAFGYDPAPAPGPRPPPRDDEAPAGPPDPAAAAAHAEALARESRMRHRQITPPILPEPLGVVEFGVSRSYLGRMVAQAEASGATVAFLFLPFYQGYRAPRERDWLARLGPVWIADFIMDDPASYRDAAHVTPEAAKAVSAWLAGRIADALTEPRP